MNSDSDYQKRWEELRRDLRKQIHGPTGESWWDWGDIREGVQKANSMGIDPELVFQCREACRSHAEFLARLRVIVAGGSASKRRILAVDDEQEFLELLRMNLEREDYCVATESDPERVVEVAREFRPDLILLDVVMHGKDGLDLLAEIREDEGLRATPVIMLTALAKGSQTGGVTKDGVLYLSKPVRRKKLILCIEEYLNPDPEERTDPGD